MKVVVIYSSITGNTEKIAKSIQAGVKQITGHCDILKMKQANPRHLYEYDLIGIGAPVHALKEPYWVETFIKDMRFVGGKHCFVFSTHGTLPGNFMASIIAKLKRKGLIIIGYDDWYGDDLASYVAYPYYTHGHPDKIDLEEAEAFGREIVVRSGKISAGETDLIPEVPKMKDIFPVEKLRKELPPPPKFAKYDKEKCAYPACRLCMDNCPVDGIDLTVEPPIFMQPCQACGGLCEAICPTGAINWEDFFAIRPSREKAERELIVGIGVPLLREAEEQGRFRRLVPEEAVDWGTRVWQVFDKHPRWIVGKGRP